MNALHRRAPVSRSPSIVIRAVARRARLPLLAAVAVIAATGLVFLCAEGALRLTGYGHSAAFTVPCTVRGQPAHCDNDRFTWQFFPPGAFRLPAAFAIPADKSPRTFRIVVVGESAAEGDPEPSYSFARFLEVMLRERFPTLSFEVVNTGIAAVSSHALLPAMRDLARREADLFVLYAGNNEVVGPYGAGSTLTGLGASLSLIRTVIRLNSTRLGQLSGSLIRALRGGERRSWTGMDMFLEQRVAADAPALEPVYRHFEHNLRDMVEVARESGARVMVSTIGVNLRHSAPFASLHRDDLSARARATWQTLVSEGDSLERSSRMTAALDRYLAAADLDDQYAELRFRLGRVQWSLGRFSDAKASFIAARELDALRFRADQRVNAIVRMVAEGAGPGVELLDAESVLAASSPHGVPGRDLFYEHVHLRPRGNYLIARAVFSRVAALLPADARAATAADPPSQAETERLLALTDYDRRRVARLVLQWLGQPPFTRQLTREEEVRALRRETQEGRDDAAATAAAYRWAIGRAPTDRWLQLNYGGFLEAHGEPAAAAVVYRRALELLPANYAAADRLAAVLARTGKYDEAIAECRALLRRMPYHPTAYMTLGYALAQTDAYDESIAAYESAIALHPPYAVDAYTRIGILRLRQGRSGLAAAAFRAALERDTPGARRADLLRRLRLAETRAELPTVPER